MKKQDRDQEGNKGSTVDVNMVFMFPREFMVSTSDEEDSDLEEGMGTFVTPEEDKRLHLKAFFLK